MSHISMVRFEVTTTEQVQAQDIIDAVGTLKPASKIVIDIPHPGKGPDHFLTWAQEELAEAEATTTTPSIRARKAFNASILSKCAVECLVDWYLSKHLLHLTIPRFPSLARKLDPLNAELLLGIGYSLFQKIIFDPRNSAIHKYELVDLPEAKHSYQLANLTILHCRNTVPPNLAPIFYGNLDFCRGEDINKHCEKPFTFTDKDTGFYFGGIGQANNHAVFIDRNDGDSKLCIFHSLGEGAAEVRYCPIENNFSSQQLREVFNHLESFHPTTIDLNAIELKAVLEALSQQRLGEVITIHFPRKTSFYRFE